MAQPSDFQTIYNSHLLPALSTLEADRKKGFTYLKIGSFTALIIIISVFYFEKGILFLLLSGGGIYFYYKHIIKEIRERYKSEVIKPMIALLSPGLTYIPEQYISRRDYDLSKLHLNKINQYGGRIS